MGKNIPKISYFTSKTKSLHVMRFYSYITDNSLSGYFDPCEHIIVETNTTYMLTSIYIGGLLSQRTAIPSILGLAPFRAHMCTVYECMPDFTIVINISDSYTYDDLF